jgi:hypothetical protein
VPNPPDVPNPDDYIGRGVVYVSFFRGPGKRGWWGGHWEADAAPGRFVQDAGEHPSADAAVEWARQRTDRVVIRLLDERQYWAGTTVPPPEIPYTFEVGDPEDGTQNRRLWADSHYPGDVMTVYCGPDDTRTYFYATCRACDWHSEHMDTHGAAEAALARHRSTTA